jgi:hypothetical protein
MKCISRYSMLDYVSNEGLFQELPTDVAEKMIKVVAEAQGVPAMLAETFNEISKHLKSCPMCLARYKGARVEFKNIMKSSSLTETMMEELK